MRLLAATLHCQENEFEACVRSIRGQDHPDFEHLVIADLPKREAHERLFGTFLERRDEFDVLVKVDADMVIIAPDLFTRIAGRFAARPDMQVLSIAVRDGFTGNLVSGLNSYRNTIPWSATGDEVFTDQFGVDPAAIVEDRVELAPAAEHCPDPGPFQAFHFGLHRGVKALVASRRELFDGFFMRMADVEATWRNYRRRRRRTLLLASLGAEMALRGDFDERHLGYSDPYPRERFARFEAMDDGTLERQVRAMRRASFGWLPGALRAELLRGRRGTLPFRVACPHRMRLRGRRLAAAVRALAPARAGESLP